MIKLNDKEVKATVFPDKTSQVWKLTEIPTRAEICWEFENESEIMCLAQLKALLDAHGTITDLYIGYLPYARQDKPISNTTTFGLHVFAKMLNALEFPNVAILDPHSEIATNLIKHSRAIYPHDQVKDAFQLTNSDIVCYPDKGAQQKYTRFDVYGKKFPYIFANKNRDQLTGKITGIEVVGDPSNKNVLLVDDLCDAGGTFIGLAKELIDAGANQVNLFVTHGLFTKGLTPLKEAGINRIFTAKGEAHKLLNDEIFYTQG